MDEVKCNEKFVHSFKWKTIIYNVCLSELKYNRILLADEKLKGGKNTKKMKGKWRAAGKLFTSKCHDSLTCKNK